MDATQPQSNDHITVVHVPEDERYELRDGERTIGFAAYRKPPGRVLFTHTEIEDSYGGQGLGSRLARFALDDVAAAEQRIEPRCEFIAAYLGRHHDYDALVDWPPMGAATAK